MQGTIVGSFCSAVDPRWRASHVEGARYFPCFMPKLLYSRTEVINFRIKDWRKVRFFKIFQIRILKSLEKVLHFVSC